MAPVIAGLCSFEGLKNGAIDICDIALMNDALAVKADNENLARQHIESKK